MLCVGSQTLFQSSFFFFVNFFLESIVKNFNNMQNKLSTSTSSASRPLESTRGKVSCWYHPRPFWIYLPDFCNFDQVHDDHVQDKSASKWGPHLGCRACGTLRIATRWWTRVIEMNKSTNVPSESKTRDWQRIQKPSWRKNRNCQRW